MRALSYTVAPGSTTEEFDEADRAYLSDDYKRRVLEHMSINQLIDTILINPTVQLSPSRRDTGFTATYSFQPLSNLVYTRDQQVRFFFFLFFFRLRGGRKNSLFLLREKNSKNNKTGHDVPGRRHGQAAFPAEAARGGPDAVLLQQAGSAGEDMFVFFWRG